MADVLTRLRTRRGIDLELSLAGVALALAALLAWLRMQESWGDFPLLLLVAIPCLALLELPHMTLDREGAAAREGVAATPAGRALVSWRGVFVVAGMVLLAASLVQLVVLLGEDDPGSATATWVSIAVGLVGLWYADRLASPGCTLAAALAFAIAGLAAVDWIDGETSEVAFRNTLLVEGVIFLLAARAIRERLDHSHVLVSVAALVLIAAATIGIAEDLSLDVLSFGGGLYDGDKAGWELVLLVASLGAIVYAAVHRYRGSVYPGLIGLAIFLSFTVTSGDLAGWPLILLAVALAAAAYGLYGDRGDRGEVAAAPPPPAGPAAPTSTSAPPG